jgi:hypothetical protein
LGEHDFVIPVETAMKPEATFQELGFTDDKATINPNLYAKTANGDPAIYTITSSKNAAPGKERTTRSEIIDIAQIRGNEALRVKINSEVDGILLNSRSTDSKLSSFSAYGVESLDNFKDLKYNKETGKGYKSLREFLDKGDVDKVKTFTNNVVTQTLFDGLFNKTDVSGNRTYTQMSADKNMVNFLNKNNILNEAGEAYSIDDVVYVKNKVTEQDKEGGGKINVYQNTLDQLNAPGAIPRDILASPISVPGGNKIGWDEVAGAYVIYKSDGTPGDTTLTLDQVKLQLQRGI